jgi:glycosyltransferase involved in cell wall biosynthesis
MSKSHTLRPFMAGSIFRIWCPFTGIFGICPFGLVLIEAMACGTPVIAYPLGSVPEVIQEGVTGFIVPDPESAVRAVERIGEIDRRKCWEHFEQHFDAERMAQNYLDIYQRLARGESSLSKISDGVPSWMNLISPSNTIDTTVVAC